MKSNSHGFSGGENILIVGDKLESLQSLSATLSENGYTVQSAISASMALMVARLASLNLILLDIKMPDIDGYEVCKKLKESTQTSDIPIIFLKGSIFTFYIALNLSININNQSTNSIVNCVKTSKLNNKVDYISLFEDSMTMPKTWLLNLNQAANEVNQDLLQITLEKLPENKASLSDSLTGLVKDFRLDIIANFTEKILENKIGSRK